MTSYLQGILTEGATSYGEVYAKVTDVTEPKDGSYRFTIAAFSDGEFTTQVYSRGSQLLDHFNNESTDSVELRALTKFRDALAPAMVIVKPTTSDTDQA